MNILVIGCGQIGSRHIQSLATARYGLTLFASDKSNDSLQKTQVIFDETKDKHKDTKLIITKNIAEITVDLDVVIIASNSRERAKLIKIVLGNFSPKHIILEKVLFNKLTDYQYFDNIFEKINTKVWVNQYMGYEFSFLPKHFNADEKFHMKVSGNWGLCCNSVHFIEIFHHLCGRIPLKLKDCTLRNEYKKSKRDGYYELFGAVNIGSSQSHKLTLECNPEEPELIKNIEIISGSRKLKDVWVDEYHNCNIIEKDGKTSSERHYSRRQSERTLEIVNSLMENGSCDLPSYHYSSYHHLLILDQFKKKFFDLGIDVTNEIPVT